ncbi:tautomerase family protein [Periweissella fabalis]|uniref:Tautomerase family protein n=1 Tax=Periweissella fabalis TaxID=1070421 RepID=A0A7X6S331_9LACO|nr:tautomerase family protein [Periweissella fabalis]MCM0599472.1 tautomerase family protein [Periweissella fabalis]NKZ23751.1 tautomerase family protein [Periweissella fabalis]
MPLLRFDLNKEAWGDANRRKKLLDIAYQVTLAAFNAPKGDRYQIVNLHQADEMIIEDTGLGFKRTENVIILSITTRPRTDNEKKIFYHDFVALVGEQLGISPTDIMINMVENTNYDWSFANGKAQFITGEL